MRVSLAPEAERDLVEGGLYYSREANEDLGRAFIAEFERSAALLGEQPELEALWREVVRRFRRTGSRTASFTTFARTAFASLR